MNAQNIGRALGWVSLVLGAGEVVAAESLAKNLGLEKRTTLVRAFGIREILSGIGILAAPKFASVGHDKLAPWIWARVAGDALDLVVLLAALSSTKGDKRKNVLIALATVAPIVALDIWCASRLSSEGN